MINTVLERAETKRRHGAPCDTLNHVTDAIRQRTICFLQVWQEAFGFAAGRGVVVIEIWSREPQGLAAWALRAKHVTEHINSAAMGMTGVLGGALCLVNAVSGSRVRDVDALGGHNLSDQRRSTFLLATLQAPRLPGRCCISVEVADCDTPTAASRHQEYWL